MAEVSSEVAVPAEKKPKHKRKKPFNDAEKMAAVSSISQDYS